MRGCLPVALGTALLLTGCFDEIVLGAHPCDSCLACERCVGVVNGSAVCEAKPAAREQCGADGNVYTADSCGRLQGVLHACLHGTCEANFDAVVGCACRNGWEGRDCSTCPLNYRAETDCDVCAGGWSGDECSTCKPGWDAAQACSACATGFASEAGECVDVDECVAIGCGVAATCVNLIGGFRCDCIAGHELSAGGCVDIDECATDNGGCDALTTCTNLDGSRSCSSCPSGYSGDGASGCVDIDECATDDGGCDVRTTCTNEDGSFGCSACPSGYSGTGLTGCVDVDECDTANGGCDGRTSCTNTAGSRTCGACPGGFTGSGATGCLDIDECATSNGGCDPLTVCTNEDGTFSCGSCPGGYLGSAQLGCTDIDECATDNGGCDPMVECTNDSGTWSCGLCPEGYTDDSGTCTDIDECATANGDCEQLCTDHDGGYSCSCTAGFLLEVDDESCYAPSWGTPELLELDDTSHAYGPELAVSPSGHAFAAFSRSNGESIWASRYQPGLGWSTAESIAAQADGCSSVQIAFEPTGNALAVWQQNYGTWFNIVANRYVVGAGWGTAGLVETDDTRHATGPDLAIDGQGNAFAVWRHDGLPGNVWAARHVPGSGWGSPVQLDALDGEVAFVRVTADASGNALVVWSQFDGTRHRAFGSRYVAGSGWQATALIEATTSGDAFDIDLFGHPAGDAFAVWRHGAGAGQRVARYEFGSGWGAPLVGPLSVGATKIAFDADGDALMAFSQSNGPGYDVWARRFSIDGGWSVAATIETETASSEIGSISIDVAGNAVACWTSGGAVGTTMATLYTAAGWGASEPIQSGTGGSEREPRVGMYGTGKAIAVWAQTDDAVTSVWGNRLE